MQDFGAAGFFNDDGFHGGEAEGGGGGEEAWVWFCDGARGGMGCAEVSGEGCEA